MKIEYLESGSDDCPLIRIYGNENAVISRLMDVFKELSQNKDKDISIHDLPGIESIEGCHLIARCSDEDKGIEKTDNNKFILTLTSEQWQTVSELVQPLCNTTEQQGYQWLDESSDISLLLSKSEKGYW